MVAARGTRARARPTGRGPKRPAGAENGGGWNEPG